MRTCSLFVHRHDHFNLVIKYTYRCNKIEDFSLVIQWDLEWKLTGIYRYKQVKVFFKMGNIWLTWFLKKIIKNTSIHTNVSSALIWKIEFACST